MSEEEARYGTGWTGGELDMIVADYFAMLAGTALLFSHIIQLKLF